MDAMIPAEWETRSPFFLLIQDATARACAGWKPADRLEALSNVWEGLRHNFADGKLVDPGDRLLKTIVKRKVISHYRSPAARSSCQPGSRSLNDMNGAGLYSGHRDPAEELAERKLWEEVEAALAAMPSRRGEAVRSYLGSYLGYPDSPSVPELARRWGTSRQNVNKHVRKGLAHLRLVLRGLDRYAL